MTSASPPIVCVPGFMLDADLWADMLPSLSPREVIHADPGAATSLGDMARRTLAAAPPRFDLLGFSMGGYVAREMARRAPDRTRRLVLIATSARPDTPEQARVKRAAAEATLSDAASFRGISRAAVRRSLGPDRENDTAMVERIVRMGTRLGGGTFARQSRFARYSDQDRLGEIACPTLIVAGRHDRLRGLDEAEELRAGIPGSRLAVLSAGHMLPLETPRSLATLIDAFLREAMP